MDERDRDAIASAGAEIARALTDLADEPPDSKRALALFRYSLRALGNAFAPDLQSAFPPTDPGSPEFRQQAEQACQLLARDAMTVDEPPAPLGAIFGEMEFAFAAHAIGQPHPAFERKRAQGSQSTLSDLWLKTHVVAAIDFIRRAKEREYEIKENLSPRSWPNESHDEWLKKLGFSMAIKNKYKRQISKSPKLTKINPVIISIDHAHDILIKARIEIKN